jgi:acetate kinase
MNSDYYILTVNCGSSSLKFSLYHHSSMRIEVMGSINNIGESNTKLLIIDNRKEVLEAKEQMSLNFEAAVKEVIQWLKANQLIYPLIAIGFRLVMGGPNRYKAELIREDVLKDCGPVRIRV